ncbi:MAG TPA: nicotinate phosphoribosyltransferase [Acidimicrobiia bacterium]
MASASPDAIREPGLGPDAALFTDLYELTMAGSYHALGMVAPATFDLYAHRLPPRRGYLVACGLEVALDYLEQLRFDDAALDYLRSLGLFEESFLRHLGDLRFTGDVWAVPEGEVVFPDEPLVRVTAPLVEAQIVETFLLNCIGFQTLIATKAARIASVCGDRSFVDFSPRRDHGTDAAMKAARAAFVGGASGTSLVLAGRELGLELSGTMAHAYVMRFSDERDAFLSFARAYPGKAVLLLDTYDTEAAAQLVAAMAPQLRAEGIVPRAVRLDSGDFTALSRSVRRTLDDAGLGEIGIFASGDLDEYRIAEIVASGATIDAFGVGTQLGTSGDAPSLDVVYKLVEDPTGPKVKVAPGKTTLPGRKQIYRVRDGEAYAHDVIALEDEARVEGAPVLEHVMAGGRRTRRREPLAAARDRRAAAVAALAPHVRSIDAGAPGYEVRLAPALEALTRKLRAEHGHAGA